MSIFSAFNPRWSAQRMSDDDRQKLLWYFQRKTSYAAWKRLADSFDGFALVVERQVLEEPVARAENSVDETFWERVYPEIIRGQVLFERGLRALAEGDRTVWLFNDRGIFDDATTIGGRWYSELVNHGTRGDHFHDGKYLSEMTDAIKRYSKAAHDTSQIIQPMMEDTPAPYAWTTHWKDDFALLPLPEVLPKMPNPATETLVRTGEMVRKRSINPNLAR